MIFPLGFFDEDEDDDDDDENLRFGSPWSASGIRNGEAPRETAVSLTKGVDVGDVEARVAATNLARRVALAV